MKKHGFTCTCADCMEFASICSFKDGLKAWASIAILFPVLVLLAMAILGLS